MNIIRDRRHRIVFCCVLLPLFIGIANSSSPENANCPFLYGASIGYAVALGLTLVGTVMVWMGE